MPRKTRCSVCSYSAYSGEQYFTLVKHLSHAEVNGKRVSFDQAATLARESNQEVVTATFFKKSEQVTFNRQEAVAWLIAKLEQQVPPCFRNEITISPSPKLAP